MTKRLVNIQKLSVETEIPTRTLRTLYRAGKISFIRAGWRTLLFDPEKVLVELGRLEVHAVK